MRKTVLLLLLLPVALLVGLIHGKAAVTDPYTVPAPVSGHATVYAYGERLTPPFVFTGLDGDTLYINGVPYDPRRPAVPLTIPAVNAELMNRHELALAALEVSTEGRDRNERLTLFRDVYEASPLVTRVEQTENGVTITWVGGEREEITLPEDVNTAPVQNRHARRVELIRCFEQTIRMDGLLAFGDRYHVTACGTRAQATLELIRLVENGQQPTATLRKDTALQNERFLADLTKQNGRKDKER